MTPSESTHELTAGSDMHATGVHVCADCDLPQHLPVLQPGQSARCPRCSALMRRRTRYGADYCLAFALCGLILFPLAQGFPLLSFSILGNTQQNLIWTGVVELWQGGLQGVAVLVFVCVFVAPLLLLCSLLYLHLPGKLGMQPRYGDAVNHHLHKLSEWAMIDVFLLGALVSFIKLSQLADVSVDRGFYALVALLACIWMAWLSHEHREVPVTPSV